VLSFDDLGCLDLKDSKSALEAERAKADALEERLSASSDSSAADLGRLESEVARLKSGEAYPAILSRGSRIHVHRRD
jgi:hypothetical protein